jgi:uncharacterized membrane-anchored protein
MTPRPSRPFATVAAGVICLGILGGMIVVHAWPLWTGQTVLLRVAPVDPLDRFRGEYVQLTTPASNLLVGPIEVQGDRAIRVTVDEPWWASLPADPRSRANALNRRVIYVQLEARGDRGEWLPVSISDAPIAGRPNLRGRVRSAVDDNGSTRLSVDYGLDRYFVQVGKGKSIELALSSGHVLHIEAAVASNGHARIRRLLVDGAAVE